MSVISFRSRRTADEDAYARTKRSASSLIYAVRRGTDGTISEPHFDELELELTVGSRWAPTMGGEGARFYATREAKIRIGPKESIVVETAELICVPYNVMGVVFPKGSLFREQGVHPLTAKIDPSWQGHLRVLLRNSGDTPRELKQGSPIASVVFWSLDMTLHNPMRFKDAELPTVRLSKWRRMLALVERPAIAMVLGSSVAAALTTYVTIKFAGG